MFTFEQAGDKIREIHVLLDNFHELNQSKEVAKNKNLKDYADGLRKSCIALGYYRYSKIKKIK